MRMWWLAALLIPANALAATPELAAASEPSAEVRGRAIAAESEIRDGGFGDTVAELTMTLRSADGRERTRRLTWRTLEADDPKLGDKSLTLFHEPRDIAGTAFLSHTYVEGDDDQWLYLPALKRVKRIASSNKSSAFVGSEFAYEDLLSDEVEKFDHRWLRDEDCGELRCFVVERRPRYADSGYTREIVWIDQIDYRPMRIDYFDRRDQLEKTLLLQDYRLYLDRFWRAHTLRMENHQTEKTSVLEMTSYRFRTGLGAQDFDASALRRLR